ncbi:MAG: hypothetical protein IK100_04700 [Muribaculaceae bacterium]|nr:hypothetical protein [Muribaculaceae bacterium]
MKKYALFTLTILLAAALHVKALTIYNTKYNNFGSINHNQASNINDDFLQLNNKTSSNIIVTDTTNIDAFTNYKYYIKFANLHNKEGKTYKVTDTHGKSKSISSTECGLVFNHTSHGCWQVSVSCSNSSLYNESVDSRTMTVKLIRNDGTGTVVNQATLDSGVDLDEGYNYLGVNVEGNTITVKIGKDQLNEVLTYQLTENDREAATGIPSVKVGYFAGPGSMISIERAVLSFDDQPQFPATSLETQWTREALDRHFAASKNPYEGYWTYLDRDMEDQWLKLGGKYTIALVENENGYDVIYVDGAQVKKSMWHMGMKKAEMTQTIFTDNFTGKWYDATLQPIDDDVFVTFESGVIVNFKFPVYKSQIRFSKVLNE